jgi:hypothetical protein
MQPAATRHLTNALVGSRCNGAITTILLNLKLPTSSAMRCRLPQLQSNLSNVSTRARHVGLESERCFKGGGCCSK